MTENIIPIPPPVDPGENDLWYDPEGDKYYVFDGERWVEFEPEGE